MDTQELQVGATGASAGEPVRSRKLIPLIAGAAVLVIVAAVGVYFFAFRSLPTTVSWAPSVSAVSPGGDLTVSGQITPAESGRLVSVEIAPFESAFKSGPWSPMPESTTTDSRGRFSIAYKTHFPVSIVMQVIVDPAGRYLGVTGAPERVRLLVLSSISLKGGGTMPTGAPLSFTVGVDPISAGRTVRIEQSSDKVRWVPVGPTALTKADGTSVVKVPVPAVGSWSYRATVAQDEKFAAAASPVVGATVEDIKAAAAAYIRIINESNVALDALNKAIDRSNTGTGFPAYLPKAAATYSKAETKAAAQLRAYGAWPQSVKSLIDQIIAQFVITADSDHQLSVVTNTDSWNRIQTAGDAASAERARLSTLIRQALGLPQRQAG